jgi:hypothetical protein
MGIAIDSDDTMRFSLLTDARPRVEPFALERGEQAFIRMAPPADE